MVVSELVRGRVSLHDAGPALMILDNCTAHRNEHLDGICEEKMVILIFLPLHSSTQVQPLDLSVFEITQRFVRRVSITKKANVQRRHIARIMDGFMAASTPRRVAMTFRHAGISLIAEEVTDPVDGRVKPVSLHCVTPYT
jgi:hypothetical protein